MICHYWCFSDGLTYQPYVCNGCHDFSMCVQNLSDFFTLTVKILITEFILLVLIKKAAVYILYNSVFDDKDVI